MVARAGLEFLEIIMQNQDYVVRLLQTYIGLLQILIYRLLRRCSIRSDTWDQLFMKMLRNR